MIPCNSVESSESSASENDVRVSTVTENPLTAGEPLSDP